MQMLKELLKEIESGSISNKEQLIKRKRALAKQYQVSLPKNADIFIQSPEELKEKVRKLLQIKPMRTTSGVAPIAVMSYPYKCPAHCTYCPTIPGVPKSYVGTEPSARRALRANYDEYKIVQGRLKQFYITGHLPEKTELIVQGGTFLSYPKDYQESFVKNCLLAMNRFPDDKPKVIQSLEEIQKENETAKIRCIAMVFETRPDYGMEKEADEMLRFGATRVEVGIQTTYDDVQKATARNQTLEQGIISNRILKDAGFKITHHYMPGLPGNTPERDLESFKEVFNNPGLRPDSIKIYPTLITEGTALYHKWKAGNYTPQSIEETIELLKKVKVMCPSYVRIMRIERDIPSTDIAGGIKTTNIRQIIQEQMKKEGLRCRCIRCREQGHVQLRKNQTPNPEDIKLLREDYEASEGKEIFLSFEDTKQDIIIGLLRLRVPSKYAHRPEVKDAAIIRELHVYGNLVPIGEKGEQEWQHRGFGKELLQEAERITKEELGLKKLVIISGIGVREYYRKQGYSREGPYMSKKL